MEKIKVLEIGTHYPLGKGGTEAFLWNIYTNIDLSKFKIDFVAHCTSDEDYIRYLNDNNSALFVLNILSKNKIISKFEIIQDVKKIIKNNSYDCIHIHASNALTAFTYYCGVVSAKVKIIIHSHSAGGKSTKKRSFINNILKHFLIGKDIVRLACSEAAGKWLFPAKYDFTLIKNGIDVQKFIYNEKVRNTIRAELGLENKFVVGHIGRFSPEKNHEFLIDIFNDMLKKNPNSVLLLAGEGPTEDTVKEKVKRLGIDGSVIFYGAALNANELYQAMDCFVLPSLYEGLGIVAIESQAAGLKILCSDGIPPEAKITGLLEFMPLAESPEKWAEKILSYNDGYERKDMSEEIKKAGYDIKETAKQMEDIYFNSINK